MFLIKFILIPLRSKRLYNVDFILPLSKRFPVMSV